MSIGEFIVHKDRIGVELVLQASSEIGNFVFGDFESRPTVPLELG